VAAFTTLNGPGCVTFISTHLWGYSMGGRIGFDFAVRNPDRLLSLILGEAAPRQSPPSVAQADLLRQGGLQALIDSTKAAMGRFPPSISERMLTTGDAEALAAASLVERPGLEAQLSEASSTTRARGC
jgi:pimeloyl-ACP methyl ester carboxylesterase